MIGSSAMVHPLHQRRSGREAKLSPSEESSESHCLKQKTPISIAELWVWWGWGAVLYLCQHLLRQPQLHSHLGDQATQVTAGPFFPSQHKGLFGSDFSLLPSSTTAASFTMMSRTQCDPAAPQLSAFGTSEDSHEWMLSAGFPGPFWPIPPLMGSFLFLVPTQGEKIPKPVILNQYWSYSPKGYF